MNGGNEGNEAVDITSLLHGHLWPTQGGDCVVQRFLGKGKSGYSYLAHRGGQAVVLKLMHAEPVPYYAFHDHKVTLEVGAYARLRELGVNVPELLEADPERGFLIKPFIPGEVATHAIAQEQLTDADVAALLRLAGRLKAHGHNLDWFPANFVLGPGGPVYVDYEVNAYHPEWSFEDWGVWYWANAAGMRAYLESGDIRHLNADPQSGKPRQDEATSQRVGFWLGQWASSGIPTG